MRAYVSLSLAACSARLCSLATAWPTVVPCRTSGTAVGARLAELALANGTEVLMRATRLIVPLLLALLGSSAWAHGGGLDANGCHHNRKTGDYHCHGGARKSSQTTRPPTSASTATKPQGLAPASPSAVAPTRQALPPGCYVGPRGGTYTITKSGRKNYSGC